MFSDFVAECRADMVARSTGLERPDTMGMETTKDARSVVGAVGA